MRQAIPLKPTEVHGAAEITCSPRRTPHLSRCLKEAVTMLEDILGQFMKNCSPWEGLTLEKLGGTSRWSRGRMWGGRSGRDKCDKLTTAPIPHFLEPLSQKRKRRLELKLNLGRREGWGKDVLRFVFISHYPSLTFHWQWVKPISPNQVWFACDRTSWTLCYTFSSPSRWGGWVIRVALVGTLCSAKVIPSQHNLLSLLNFIFISILSHFFCSAQMNYTLEFASCLLIQWHATEVIVDLVFRSL